MYVKQLILRNFRNYDDLELTLTPSINIFYGDNAQGKTNLLEGVYYCALGRSHRTTREKECIQTGKNEAYVCAVCSIRGKEEIIEITLKKTGHKSIKINHFPVKKISELIGRIHVVVFSPEDLSLIKEGPQFRRKFIDMELSQVDSVYLHDLQQYYHVLRQRNQLLKDENDLMKVKDTIFAWDRQLVYYGVRIMERRMQFVRKLESFTAAIHEKITGEKEKLTLSYECQAPADQDDYLDTLERHLERDLRIGTTGDGPQHDDMMVCINGSDVRIYGSQGQQRTAALSLKLAEMQMLKEETGDDPILLLDDVMSELDKQRQRQLTSYIKENQTIITCTGIEDSIRSLMAEGMYFVNSGQVRQIGLEEEVKN